MALVLKNTKESEESKVKVVVYGPAGVGKTSLAKTCPAPLLLSMESGLLSLKGENVTYLDIKSADELEEALEAVKGPGGEPFKTVILDSISELSHIIRKEEENNPANKSDKGKDNGFKVYSSIAARTIDILMKFRDLDKHVVLIAQERQKTSDNSISNIIPQLEGHQAGERLPYLFDLVMCMRYADEVTKAGERYLQTCGDNIRVAKDRSGRLDPVEAPDLGAIFAKVNRTENEGSKENAVQR